MEEQRRMRESGQRHAKSFGLFHVPIKDASFLQAYQLPKLANNDKLMTPSRTSGSAFVYLSFPLSLYPTHIYPGAFWWLTHHQYTTGHLGTWQAPSAEASGEVPQLDAPVWGALE